MEIPLFELERLEKKYNIHIHIVQSPDKTEIYQIFPSLLCIGDNKKFLGYSIQEAEKTLRKNLNKKIKS